MAGKVFYVRNRGKVTGPFDLQQLKFLRDRGQLARFHEVSEDRKSWVQAARIEEMFPAAPVPTATAPSSPVKAAGDGWMYADRNGNQHGPINPEELAQLRRTGAIDNETLVWKEGMAEWLPRQVANPGLPVAPSVAAGQPSRPYHWLAFATVGMILLVVSIGGGMLYWHLAPGRSQTGDGAGTASHSNPITEMLAGGSTIRGLNDEKHIAEAVGFVVCGVHVVEPDGTQGDVPLFMGSAFLVSPNGHLVTNKHVVEKIANLMNAELLLKQFRDKLVDVKPTVWVFFEKQKYEASILHLSDQYDMAILKIKRQHTPYFRLADTDSLPRGLRIVACGYPGAAQVPLTAEEALRQVSRDRMKTKIEAAFAPRDFEYIRTDGTVSRVTTEDGSTRRWIQHTASISGGNSGGPLLDEKGRVIGINTLVVKAGVTGIFYSVATPQLKDEIAKHVPGMVWE